MNWKDILKAEEVSLDEMLREIYEDFIDDLEYFARRYESPVEDGSRAEEAKDFYELIADMKKLDPVKDAKEIYDTWETMEGHEVTDYGINPVTMYPNGEYENEEEVRRVYEKVKGRYIE